MGYGRLILFGHEECHFRLIEHIPTRGLFLQDLEDIPRIQVYDFLCLVKLWPNVMSWDADGMQNIHPKSLWNRSVNGFTCYDVSIHSFTTAMRSNNPIHKCSEKKQMFNGQHRRCNLEHNFTMMYQLDLVENITDILLVEEILHHLGCISIKPWKIRDNYPKSCKGFLYYR